MDGKISNALRIDPAVYPDGRLTLRRRMVMVEWVDSAVDRHGWKPVQEMTLTAPTAYSVGFVAAEDERRVVLVPHMIESQEGIEEQGCGEMTIPKCSIRSLVELQLPLTSSSRTPSWGRLWKGMPTSRTPA